MTLDRDWVVDTVRRMAGEVPEAFAAASDEMDRGTPGLDRVRDPVLPRLEALDANILRLIDRPRPAGRVTGQSLDSAQSDTFP